jgi:hypothetical protein
MPPCPVVARTTGILLASCSFSAAAWQLDYSLAAAAGYSDNVNQSANDPVGQAMLIPRVTFDAREEGEALRVQAAGQVEYRDYLQGDFDGEVRGRVSGIATWIISPQRFAFDFEEYAAVEPVNILATNAPGNTQQTNVFSLGPTFNFRLQPTLNGQAELRLSNSTASRAKDFNSNRAMGAVRLLKNLDPTDVLSANVEYRDVHFTDRSGGPDYRRADAFARYQSKLADIDIDVALGGTRLAFDQAGTHSGALARGALAWRATPSQTLTLGALCQFSDSSADLVVDPLALAATITSTGVLVGTSPITSQVYVEKRVSLAWAWQGERLQLRAEPYKRKFDYVLDPTLDEDATGATAGFSYRIHPTWTLAFDATDERREFRSLDRRDEDMHYDLSLTDRFNSQWSGRVDLIRNERHSNAADQRFDENIAFVTVIFTR